MAYLDDRDILTDWLAYAFCWGTFVLQIDAEGRIFMKSEMVCPEKRNELYVNSLRTLREVAQNRRPRSSARTGE